MNSLNKHISNILRAKDEESLAIFVGAGVSKSSETKYIKMPSWGDLINALISDLNVEDESDYLKIAQLYYLSFGEYLYYKKVKDFFPENIRHSKIHDLIFKLNPHAVITTNWDTLLESAINDKSYFYNVISSDKDLMKSYLGKKLIKMHGDFKNHNIVFKEDDYINYRYNFPLIENYVKSILSTHTVLFLGYSYNDMDLKQIIKWTQNHSIVRPPMYLVVFNDIPSQRKYLESHGITTLILTDDKYKKFGNDTYSNKLFTFLHGLNSLELCNDLTEIEIIDAIYSRIKSLQTLNAILADQVTRCFTNSGFIYIDDNGPKALLIFYDGEVTSNDNNVELRNFYKKFLNILNNEDKIEKYKSRLQKIFMILRKANIYGVVLNSKRDQAILTSEILLHASPIKIDNEIDFNYNEIGSYSYAINSKKKFDKINAYKYYQVGKYDEAYGIIEDELSDEIKQRDYANLLMSFLNQNIVLNRLKYDYLKSNEVYSQLEENKINDLYESLPRNIRKTVSVIYDLVTFNYLFNLHYTVSSLLIKYKDLKKTKQVLLIDSDNYKAEFIFENLMLFILKNGCLIDIYKEFRDVIRMFIEITLIKESSNSQVSLKKLELYASVKYINSKALASILTSEDNSPIKLTVPVKDMDWLVNTALQNLKNTYINYQGASNPVESEIVNVLRIASQSSLSCEMDSIALKTLNDILKSSYNNLVFYDCLTEYVTIRFNLYRDELSISGVKNIINTIVDKLIANDLGGYDRIAIVNRGLANLFSVAGALHIEFDDNVKIEKLLSEVSGYSDSDRARASETIIYDLYKVTRGEVKERIKSFIRDTPTKGFNEERKIKFDLFLLAADICNNFNGLPEKLEGFVEKYNGFRFNSEAITIKNLLNVIVNKRGRHEFSTVLSRLDGIISNYKMN